MVPPRAQPFIGRAEDLAWLLQQFRNDVGVTLALCGDGGMGKTALAAEALMLLLTQEDWLKRFPGGIFYHSFYSAPSLDVAFEELAHIFGEEPSADPRRAALRALSRRRTLLVFDGLEMLDDTHLLREFGGKHVVLLLSRRQSDAPDPAHRRTLELLSLEQGMMFLQELAEGRAAERACAERLVQHIGGYPLALRIIGRYLAFYQEKVADYLQWFEQSPLAALDHGKHRIESVPILLQRTYDALKPNEQHVFALQGLLAPASFPLELVQNVLELPEREVQQTLGSLVNLSVLLRRDLTYEVSHPLVHTFAKERLSAQDHPTSFPSPDTITTWREKILTTLTTHFEQSDPYGRSDLSLWQPHVLSFLSINDLTTEQDLKVAYLFNEVGFVAHAQGKYVDAEPLYKRALTIREAQLGPMHPDTAQSLNNLAELYRSQEKYVDAEPLHQRALTIREAQLGSTHPDTANSLNNLTMLYQSQGKYVDAEPLYKRALTIREEKLGPTHPDTAKSLNNLASLYVNQEKYAEAEPLCQRALTILEEQLGASHPNTALSLNNLALLYHYQEKYAEAEPLYKRALAIREAQLGPDHPDTAQSLNTLAILYYGQGKYTEAEPLMRRALAIYEEQLGSMHSITQNIRQNYLLLQKNIDEEENKG